MGFNEAEQTFIYVLCTFILALKVNFTNNLLGIVRTKTNSRTHEDYKTFKTKPETDENLEKAKQQQIRYDRMVQNDMENIPYGLFVFWAGYFVDRKSLAMVIPLFVYTIARVLFSVFYALEMQPYRTIVYSIGQLSMVIGGITGIILAADEL